MTLGELIKAYQTDPVSGFHKLRFSTRRNQRNLMRQIRRRYGATRLKKIKARTLIEWHSEWVDGTKAAAGHAFVKKLRTIFGFGLTILENKQCRRLRVVMHTLRFPAGRKRKQRLTPAQAKLVIAEAHRQGLHSIALAQAFQTELILRQKDVIGEWVPRKERIAAGDSDTVHKGRKWLRGLRGDEIDHDLILRHTTSKRLKDIEVDLKVAPMVMAELGRLIGRMPQGPLIVNEHTGRPYADDEFRRKWRKVATAAGIPKHVCNMDSKAGSISEAFAAKANPDFIRQTAQHSELATTQGYNRGDHLEVSSDVMRARAESRLAA